MSFGNFRFRSTFESFSFCKETISVHYFLWDHLCIKEDLGYFDKNVLLHGFLQGKKFCNFVFSFIGMIYNWRGDFFRGIFIGSNFLGGKFLGWKFWQGGAFIGGYFHRRQFSPRQFSGGGAIFRGEIFVIPEKTYML